MRTVLRYEGNQLKDEYILQASRFVSKKLSLLEVAA